MRGRAFILVEGKADALFFNSVVNPLLRKKYRLIKTVKRSETKDKIIAKQIPVFKRLGICLFIRDMNDSPCKTALKNEVLGKFNNLSNEDIHIVVREIEGWYMAGANSLIEKLLQIELDEVNANTFTKEDFLSLKPATMTKTQYYGTFLKHFDIEQAKARNESLRRFLEECAP